MPTPDNPSKILHQEVEALNTCLKDILVATARVYKFYAEIQKLGIASHAPNPPQALTASLGREVEKYDQICDLIQVQLDRAISNLKYELRQEEAKIAEEERKKQLAAAMLPPPIPEPATSSQTDENDVKSSPVSTVHNTPIGRRPSAISISSLQRPQLPLKLDLSSAAFRISEEEASLYSKGLASPATLAPKSARPLGPGEFPAELMAAFAGTPLATSMPSAPDMHPLGPPMQPPAGPTGLGILGLGNSADKPIELDLEGMDGMDIDVQGLLQAAGSSNANHTHDNLFSPVDLQGATRSDQQQNSGIIDPDTGSLDAGAFDTNVTDELFGDLESTPGSPSAILAQLETGGGTAGPSGSNPAAPGALPDHFDLTNIGLLNSQLNPTFFSASQDNGMNFPVDMDLFMSVDQSDGHNQNNTSASNPPAS